MPIVLFSRPVLKRSEKVFVTLKVSRFVLKITILSTKLESVCLIYLDNTIKIVCGS